MSDGAFPQEASALLERLGSLYGLRSELEEFRRAAEPLAAVPIETSVSLRASPQTDPTWASIGWKASSC